MRMCSLCGYSGAWKASRRKVLDTRAVGSRSGRVGSLDADGDSGSCCGLLLLLRSVFAGLWFELELELVTTPPATVVLANETAADASIGDGSRIESGTRGSNEFRARTSNWRGLLRTMLAATFWVDAMDKKEEES